MAPWARNVGAVLNTSGLIWSTTLNTPVGESIVCTCVLLAEIFPPAVSDDARIVPPAMTVVQALRVEAKRFPPTSMLVPALMTPSDKLFVIEIAPVAFTFPRAMKSVN